MAFIGLLSKFIGLELPDLNVQNLNMLIPSFFQSANTRPLPKALLWGALILSGLIAWLGIGVDNLNQTGWRHGFDHPLEGWDHLVTMLAVGIWAAQMRGRAIWQLPLAFVSVMSLGGLAGASGLVIASAESIILLSTAVFGILITRRIRFSSKINILIVAFFAFFHGFAHGHEISASASLLSYTLGFTVATLLLHGAGIVAAKLAVIVVTGLLTALLNFGAHASARLALDDSMDGAGKKANQSFQIFASAVNNHQRYANKAVPHVDVGGYRYSPSSYLSPHKYGTHADSVVARHAGLIKTSYQLLSPGLEHSPLNVAIFNHYYPAINHSPGLALASNGVGRTSPPNQKSFNTSSVSIPYFPLIAVFLVQLTCFLPDSFFNFLRPLIQRVVASAIFSAADCVRKSAYRCFQFISWRNNWRWGTTEFICRSKLCGRQTSYLLNNNKQETYCV